MTRFNTTDSNLPRFHPFFVYSHFNGLRFHYFVMDFIHSWPNKKEIVLAKQKEDKIRFNKLTIMRK